MNIIERARELFFRLENGERGFSEIALRSFEIQSRLASCRRDYNN